MSRWERKRRDKDADEDVELSQALPVADGTEVDLSRPPEDGLEYLLHVRMEAAKYPTVLNAPVDSAERNAPTTTAPPKASDSTVSPKKKRSYFPQACAKAPAGLDVNADWERQFVSGFANLRRANALKRRMVGDVTMKFPATDDAWRLFCFGADGHTGGRRPTCSVLYAMKQRTVGALVELLTAWLDEESSLSEAHAEWLFATLVMMDEPFNDAFTSTLRQLARRCATIRATLTDPDDAQLARLNVIITIVYRCFKQLDLFDS